MLKLEQVRKSYGSLTAVDGISIEVRRGEIFGLLGPNGAGKSTTMHMIVGLLHPDGGKITIGDGGASTATTGSPTSPAVRRRLGLAPQSLAIYEELTAEENLEFFGRM